MSVQDCERIVKVRIPQKCDENKKDFTCRSNSSDSVLFLSYKSGKKEEERITGWEKVILRVNNPTAGDKKIKLAAPELLEFLGELAKKGINVKEVHDELEWWFETFTEKDRIKTGLPAAEVCTGWMYRLARDMKREAGMDVTDTEVDSSDSDKERVSGS
jgi:hypothetical protein